MCAGDALLVRDVRESATRNSTEIAIIREMGCRIELDGVRSGDGGREGDRKARETGHRGELARHISQHGVVDGFADPVSAHDTGAGQSPQESSIAPESESGERVLESVHLQALHVPVQSEERLRAGT